MVMFSFYYSLLEWCWANSSVRQAYSGFSFLISIEIAMDLFVLCYVQNPFAFILTQKCVRFYCGFVQVSTIITIKKSLCAVMPSVQWIYTIREILICNFNCIWQRENARADHSFRWFYISCCGCWKAWNEHIIGATMEIYANSLLYILIFWRFA